MASAVARAYNGVWGGAPSGGPGQSPRWRVREAKPPEAEAFLAFWTSNGCNKFAPFALYLVCSRFKQQAIEKPIG